MNDPLWDLFCRLPGYWQLFIILLFPLSAVMNIVMDNPAYTVSALGPCHNLGDVFAAVIRDLTSFI